MGSRRYDSPLLRAGCRHHLGDSRRAGTLVLPVYRRLSGWPLNSTLWNGVFILGVEPQLADSCKHVCSKRVDTRVRTPW